jgi:class 3 adenylate cyclase/predicted ATPase
MDVAEWLRRLGLEAYEAAFHENDVGGELLPSLTAEDLKDLGVASVGHRRRLLEAIAALHSDALLTRVPGDVSASAPRTDHPAPTGASAERRQLSVMFCDLAGFTSLSSRLDPEDLGTLIRGYQSSVAAAIKRFGGFIARYVGDGVLIYFGWPEASEEDAERAIRAALAVVATINRASFGAERLMVRIGIATGLVVVGEPIGTGEARQQTAIGETPNLASRLQALAAPDGVMIDATTRQQIGGLFDCDDCGMIELKGISEPVQAWRVVGEAAVASRFEALHAKKLTPLVGRDEEFDLLLRRYEQVKAGAGRVVLITGEPGIGKSRLLAVLSEHLRNEACGYLRYFCSPHNQDSPLHPIIRQLEFAAKFDRKDAPSERWRKLRALLADTDPEEEEIALLADLLSLDPDGLDVRSLSPQHRKERTFEALLRQAEVLCRKRPLLMLFEDMHWADPSTCELLDLTVGRMSRLRALLIMTFRPEFQAPWIGHAGVTTLILNRLDRTESTELAELVTREQMLPPELLDRIVDQADGVPLFIEELSKVVLESAVDTPGVAHVLGVPGTLQASLLARLDRLPYAKQVAQIGAVLGREFTHELISAVACLSSPALANGLDQLVASGLVHRRGEPPDAVYRFKHALLQEASYSTLLRNPRQQAHSQAADALSRRPEAEPEVIAYHLTEAGRTVEAVDHWFLAGQRAAGRSANREAVSLLRRGLTALQMLPESEERDRQELAFQMALGMPLVATERYGTAAVGSVYERARVLGGRVGDSQSQLIAAYGTFVNSIAQGDPRAAKHIAEQTASRFAGEHTPTCRIILHRMAGTAALQAGIFGEARRRLEAVLALYEAEVHSHLAGSWGLDARVGALGYLTIVLWLLGYPDQAYRRMEEAFEASRLITHAGSIGHAHHFAGVLFADIRRDPIALQQRAAAAVSFAREHGQIGAGREFFRGLALFECGAPAEGVTLAEQCLARMNRFGLEGRIYMLGRLAAIYVQLGHVEKAWETVNEAKLIAEQTADYVWYAEIHRVAGKVLLAKGASTVETEAQFHRAIELARQQNAKSLELRGAIDLARLWFGQGKGADARAVLAPIYGWFTEGFDTLDLKEAAALLAELGSTQM